MQWGEGLPDIFSNSLRIPMRVERRPFTCSRINTCPYSLETCRKTHSGLLVNDESCMNDVFDVFAFPDDEVEEHSLAVEVFYFVQNTFHFLWKHAGDVPLKISKVMALHESRNRLRRHPGWTFHVKQWLKWWMEPLRRSQRALRFHRLWRFRVERE